MVSGIAAGRPARLGRQAAAAAIIGARPPSANRSCRIDCITGVNGPASSQRGAVELKDIDLNLLVVLHQLHQQRRVSAVAATLGLSQPAISNALRRLRGLLGDELFLRTPSGMQPTPLAEQLAGPVAAALGQLHGALNAGAGFEAATSPRRFCIAMSDIGEIHFLPRLLEALARQAPQVALATVRDGAVPLQQALEAGQVDLAVGWLPQLQAGIYQRKLFSQRYVCLLRQGHPLARKQRLSLAAYAAAEHVQVDAVGTGHGKLAELIQRGGVQRQVRLTVPHFVAVGHILATTDLLATVPERYAQCCEAPFGLVQRPLPMALPEIDINLFWHAKVHRDPANQWLRGLVIETFGVG